MSNKTSAIHKPFLHNPFLVVLTALLTLLSIFSLGLLFQFVAGYQDTPPVEFMVLPIIWVTSIGIGIESHPDCLFVTFYGVPIWKDHNTKSEWVQLKSTDKVETLRLSRNGTSRLTLMVRKRATPTQENE